MRMTIVQEEVVHSPFVYLATFFDTCVPFLSGAAFRVQLDIPCRSPKRQAANANVVRPSKVMNHTIAISNTRVA